ncbi:hypothetical protein D3C87_1163390 [compost metagenome]|jgi:hypothetical protein|uniref:hypothetical protein n=1 Tax=Sphingobacterium TaxID=28453 RepID=UPI0004E5F558|nr:MULTISPECIES: hypothetical protein [Sphingobacterium]CDS93303.1 conserved hypothetical protein [Sphingobacterium sp. PM2-P1-29]SJN48581.1 hypothetical protein FM120_21575 [Sphingobacterium faecium PCAi_F2.5]HCU46744.1 hypothetical protein [Sphingobacterium sp.]MQP29199.1 hypothetical protein [Sphingobacterium faecium]PTX13446.1 hypothetical protein C8N37_101183 [Sphingobacterium faecium]
MIGELIEKEQISSFKIVAANEDRTQTFLETLKGALRLGNEFKSKTTIAFQTEAGPKRVETTVWSLTDKYLQIKSGVLIPLRSILAIEY